MSAITRVVRWSTGTRITQQDVVAALVGCAFGGVLAAGAVFRHQRLPLWGAALVGIGVVLLMLVVPLLWERVIRT